MNQIISLTRLIPMGDEISDGQSPDYWIGPYEVRVPTDINLVVASDGYNRHRRDGCVTEMFTESEGDSDSNTEPMNREKYLSKYTELRSDGFYYYKKGKARNSFFSGFINQF